jgi:AMP-polyphosphate phosphotransferase
MAGHREPAAALMGGPARREVPMAKKAFRLAKLDMDRSLPGAEYNERIQPLQFKLRATELAYRRFGHRALIVLEGWDAGGKGGLIRRLSAEMDPRAVKVWPIAAPTPEEQARHYLYRFWIRVPEPGTIAVFDRSWYGRVLVERVEKLARKSEWKRAYDEINGFEAMLIDSGARVVKLFLHITPEEQRQRFLERLRNPYKNWKLTPEDLRNRVRWDDYEEAVEDMIERTSTKEAPWHVIPANDKKYARITGLEIITDVLSDGIDISPPPLDPEVARMAEEMLDPERGDKPDSGKSRSRSDGAA